ncbi:hypothetical protein LCGC14_0396820 [marine sediment metagenome]|uniref:Uncharacterized protein n=1 Tax=marine sediment metagenome TaxID=412755 RepID=A0A0F9SY89_9ZZZZ
MAEYDISELTPSDYAIVTVSSTALTLANTSPAMPSGTKQAVITVEDDQVRYREDGTSPTASEGHLLEAGDVLQYLGGSHEQTLAAVKFIRVTADAKLKVSYYK